jgi:hypothetical protein
MSNDNIFGLGHTALGAPSAYVPLAAVGITVDDIPAEPPADVTDPSQALKSASFLLAYGGLNSNLDEVWNRVRGATVFHNVVATASGDTQVWDPGEKRFRILGFALSIAGTIASTGVLTVQLRDEAEVIWRGFATVTDTTPIGDTQLGADYGLIGLIASDVEDVLYVNLSTAMLTGGVAVNVWGVEEPAS